MSDAITIRVCLVEDDYDVIKPVMLEFEDSANIELDVCVVNHDPDTIQSVKSLFADTKTGKLLVQSLQNPAKELPFLASTLVQGQYHVLLVDLGLSNAYPIGSRWQAGLDLLKELERQKCSSVPVVLTGHGQEENHVEAVLRGAQTLIAKKGAETWQVLPVYIRAAYAHWQYVGERRQREWGEALAEFASRYAFDLCEASEALERVLGPARNAKVPLMGGELTAACEASSEVKLVSDHLTRVLGGKPKASTTRTEPILTDTTQSLGKAARSAKGHAFHFGYDVEVEIVLAFRDNALIFEREFEDAVRDLAYMAVDAVCRRCLPGAGKVVISSAREENFFVVRVEDNGGLYDRTRPDDESSVEYTITQVMRVVEKLHGGSLLMNANAKGGMTATIRIPLPKAC